MTYSAANKESTALVSVFHEEARCRNDASERTDCQADESSLSDSMWRRQQPIRRLRHTQQLLAEEEASVVETLSQSASLFSAAVLTEEAQKLMLIDSFSSPISADCCTLSSPSKWTAAEMLKQADRIRNAAVFLQIDLPVCHPIRATGDIWTSDSFHMSQAYQQEIRGKLKEMKLKIVAEREGLRGALIRVMQSLDCLETQKQSLEQRQEVVEHKVKVEVEELSRMFQEVRQKLATQELLMKGKLTRIQTAWQSKIGHLKDQVEITTQQERERQAGLQRLKITIAKTDDLEALRHLSAETLCCHRQISK